MQGPQSGTTVWKRSEGCFLLIVIRFISSIQLYLTFIRIAHDYLTLIITVLIEYSWNVIQLHYVPSKLNDNNPRPNAQEIHGEM